MLRFIFLVSIVSLLLSCHVERKGAITVAVEYNGNKLSESELSLFRVVEKLKKEEKIFTTKVDLNGKVKWEIDYENFKEIKIIVQSTSLETLYLPEIKYFKTPSWWQEQEMNIVFHLKEISFSGSKKLSKEVISSESQSKNEVLLDFPEDPISQSIFVAQIESNLLPEVLKYNYFDSISDINKNKQINIEKKEIKEIGSSELNTITENKNVLFEDSIGIEIFSNGKPLDNAQVYIGRNATQNVSYVGSSDLKGYLVIPMPKQRRGDMFYIKKNSYITLAKPITSGSGRQKLKVEMQSGKSTDFLLQSFAYGVGRGMDKTELQVHSLKVDVSGVLGFVTLPKQFDEKSNMIITQKYSIPDKFDSSFLKKALDFHNLSNQIPFIYVSSLTPYKPAVGLIEPPLIGALQTNMLWRRVRREFFSRFMNEPFMRGVIFDDVQKMANSLDTSPVEMAKMGWKNAPFSPELDMLMQIQFIEDGNDKIYGIEGKVYDKSGRVISERKLSFSDAEAEKTAAKMYSNLNYDLPVEGALVKKNKAVVTLNLGKNFNVSEGDLFVAYVSKSAFSPPDKPVGILKIKSVGERESSADVISGFEKIEKADVVHVIRYPEKVIQMEIQKHMANSL